MEREVLSVIEFDYKDKKQLKALIEIHKAVLPESFVVKMGWHFMSKFYYSVLVRMGFLKCFLADYNNNYVGIIVTNKKPFSLIKSAIPTNLGQFILAMTLSIVSNPLRLGVLLELLRYKPDPLLREFEETGKAFEILTIGVKESHRKLVVDNLKIAHHLLKQVVADYEKQNFERITGQIIKSNQAALGFYRKYNAEYIQSTVRSHGVIMDLKLKNVVIHGK